MDKDDRKRIDTEKERRKEYLKKLRKELKNSPKEVVQFMSLQQPPDPDLTFNFEGIQDYVLVHGGVYTLPTIIIEHLRSKKVPVYAQYDPNPDTTKLKTEPAKVEDRITGYTPRFALNPVQLPPQPSKEGG